MRTTRLNERDLTRIVRRVLREEDTSSMSDVCFNNTTISIPSSCRIKPTSDSVVGTGISIGKNCLSDIGAMMTMKNLTEVSKLLMCLSKGGTLPTDQDIKNVNDNKARKKMNDYIKNLSPEEKVKFEKSRKEDMRMFNK
jgi:hypothetical protein